MRWSDENGEIAPHAYGDALAQLERMKAHAPHAEKAGVSRASWTWLGPGNVGGRITAILNTSANPDVILVNNPGGGIWRSIDRGSTWKPVNDFMANLAVSALVSSPIDPRTMYAGTGGGPNQPDDSFGTQLRGAGVFKSTDGGDSWQQLPATAAADWSRGVERIALSPDGQTLLAAVKYFYSDVPAAIMRSTDGGNSWSDTLKLPRTNATSVEFNPVNGSRAIASSFRKAYTSIDGGASWQESTGLPDPGSKGLITLGYARSNPEIVYAGVNVNGGEVYKSSDAGKSYSMVNTGTNYVGTQGWYCNVLWVDPIDENKVVVAGLDAFRSTDGGTTFTKISKWEKPATKSAHADHGVVAAAAGYDGKSNKNVFFGNDGGIYRVQDIDTVEEQAGWELLNKNLGITQLYGAAVSPAGVIVAGAQDNGTQRYSGDLNQWAEWQGGDGGYCAADPTNPNIFYGEYTNMTIYRSDDGGVARPDDIYGEYDYFDGSNWVKKTHPGAITEAKGDTANFIAPFILDPNKPNRMLAGARSLWASDNVNIPKSEGWPSWTAIKPPAGEASENNIGAIAVAPKNSEIIWVGHNNGDLFTTSNGLSPTPDWKQVNASGSQLPKRFVTRLAIDPSDARTVYATYGGFSENNIWRTTDGGSSWSSATGSGAAQLPNAPVYTLAIHPKNSKWLYAGTEVGIFTSEDGGASWSVPQDGPANVSVNELFFSGNTLYAATFGRGLFKIDLSSAQGKTAVTCYTLTMSSDDPSRGGVLADVAPDCNGGTQYTAGTSVHLRAKPTKPFGFASWAGDTAAPVSSVTVTMNANRAVVANFTASQACFTLTMNIVPANSGTVSISPPPDCGSNGYSAGTEVSFHATPGAGYAFGGWQGDYFDVDPVGSIVMDDNATISAIFAVPATNDELTTATRLTAGSTVIEDTSNASGSPTDPDLCVAGKSGKTVWFQYTATDNGVLVVETTDSNYHTIVAAFPVNPSSSKRIGCSDRALPGTQVFDIGDELASDETAGLQIGVTAGVTYLIEIGDATQPVNKENLEFDTGDDPTDTPDGGLLQVQTRFTKAGSNRRRATR